MPKQSFPDLTEEQARRIRQAFLDAIYSARNRAQVNAIAEALARGDIEAVIRALALDPAVFRGLERAIEQAFEAGGEWQIDRLLPRTTATGARVDILFNVRAYGAESWLRNHSSTLIRELINEQVVAARNFLTANLEAGRNPISVSQSLVGTYNRATGKREGGIIGLTVQDEAAARRFAQELADPKRVRFALARGLDVTSRKIIKSAIDREGVISPNIVGKLVVRYRNRMLDRRGRRIGRTETMAALHQGSFEAMRQGIEAGQVDRDLVTGKWKTAKDSDVRFSHSALEGREVPFGDAFVTPRGNRLRYPGDPSAPAEEIVNCRCTISWNIDFFRQAARDARAREPFAVVPA